MKAILIVDMPNECDECPLQDGEKCYARQDWISTISNWKCPLKPMPQKKDLRDYAEKIGADFNLQTRIMDYVNGYNKCIDEILGD